MAVSIAELDEAELAVRIIEAAQQMRRPHGATGCCGIIERAGAC